MAESGQTGPLSSDILAVESFIDKLGAHLGEASAPVTKKKGEGKKKGAAPPEPPAAELPPSVAAFEKCDIRDNLELEAPAYGRRCHRLERHALLRIMRHGR